MCSDLLRTCCFIGHRTINETEELKRELYDRIERLIIEEKQRCFCLEVKAVFVLYIMMNKINP